MNESSPDRPGFFARWRRPTDRPARIERLVLCTVLTVYVALLLVWAVRRDFVTYRQDFGETFVAYRQSENLRDTFPRYGMLHVQQSPAGKDLVYTHNVNLGTYYFFLLRTLGVENRAALTLSVLPVYVLSLFVAYLTVRAISGSRLTALLFLGLMLLDFANVGAFAFNALRAWHYLGLFALFWGVHAIGNPPEGTRRRSPLLALAAGAMISFGCGYDFFVIAGACAGAFLLLTVRPGRLWPALGWLAAASLLPFTLRQLEVIYWMGLHTWSTDFYLTVAIKVPFASRFITIPSITEIDTIYESAGLMRPPAYPTSDLAGIWNTLAPLFRLALIPAYGLLGCMLAATCAVAGVAASLFARHSPRSRLLVLPAAYFFGAATGLFIFAPFSLHVYVKHNFPLIAGLIHLAEAVGISLALLWGRRLLQERAYLRTGIAVGLAAGLIGNTFAVQFTNARHSHELDYRWIRSLHRLTHDQELPAGSIIAAAMMPPKSKGLIVDETKVTILAPDKAPWILAQAAGLLVDQPLYAPDPAVGTASQLLYAPGDGWCNVDAREPDLSHEDWLVALAGKIGPRQPTAGELARVRPALIVPPPATIHPGDIVHLKFWLPLPDGARLPRCRPELAVTDAGGDVRSLHNVIDDVAGGRPTGAVSLLYNAKFQTLDVYWRPALAIGTGGRTDVTVRGRLHFGAIVIETDPVPLFFSPDSARIKVVPVLPEPTTAQLMFAFPRCRVIERGEVGVGYVFLETGRSASP